MSKIIFKRKISGKDGWGVGLDYLFKEHWDKIDDLIRDNYFGKHEPKLINPLFSNISVALDKSILEMKTLCRNSSPGLKEWTNKARRVKKLAASSRSLNEKVIFIDTAVQFLRATSAKNEEKISKKKFTARKEASQIRGLVASCGKKRIRGTARIILDKKYFSKIKKGGILITRETNPEFLPAMIRAAAIITDLGGLLCHAAIVARELKKTCIVNTEIATSVLQNGDLIEIDTATGIVKLIRKAK